MARGASGDATDTDGLSLPVTVDAARETWLRETRQQLFEDWEACAPEAGDLAQARLLTMDLVLHAFGLSPDPEEHSAWSASIRLTAIGRGLAKGDE